MNETLVELHTVSVFHSDAVILDSDGFQIESIFPSVSSLTLPNTTGGLHVRPI